MGEPQGSALAHDTLFKPKDLGSREEDEGLGRAEIAQWIEAMCEASRGRCRAGGGASFCRRWLERALDAGSLMLFGLIAYVHIDEHNFKRIERHVGVNPMDYDTDILASIRFREFLRQQPIGITEGTILGASEARHDCLSPSLLEDWSVSYIVESSNDSETGCASERHSTLNIRGYQSIKPSTDDQDSPFPPLPFIYDGTGDLSLTPAFSQADNAAEVTEKPGPWLVESRINGISEGSDRELQYPRSIRRDAFRIRLRYLPCLVVAAALFLHTYSAWGGESRLRGCVHNWSLSYVALFRRGSA